MAIFSATESSAVICSRVSIRRIHRSIALAGNKFDVGATLETPKQNMTMLHCLSFSFSQPRLADLYESCKISCCTDTRPGRLYDAPIRQQCLTLPAIEASNQIVGRIFCCIREAGVALVVEFSSARTAMSVSARSLPLSHSAARSPCAEWSKKNFADSIKSPLILTGR